MKPLPKYLEYAFLEKDSLLQVVISALLKDDEKKCLLSILKKHKEAFGWKTLDILGISPSFCKHKIYFEDDAKPVIQRQRRLNPNMKEVMKKEIIKLLDAGVIYPIKDKFDIEIKNKKGAENVAADHLSRLENPNLEELRDEDIDDNFPDEILMNVLSNDEGETPWFADFANYLVGKILKKGFTYAQRCKFFSELKHYFWDDPYLFKMSPDGMIRRCVYCFKTWKILDECHHGPTGGHYGPSTTTKKVFDVGFYWLTIFKEAHTLVQYCDACQHSGSLSRRDEMP
ncbi:reverse transcriptase domain-containing protein [Tanacetum coccineum]